MSNNTFIGNNQINNEKSHIERRHSSTKHRNENDDDEGAVWSVSSNGGLSRSSHDDGFVFQNVSIHSDNQEFVEIDKFSGEKSTNEEYFKLINNKNQEYFYDGTEEILLNSDNEQINNNEDDERLFNNDDRTSFTREQLVEYQQLIKLLRFVKSGGRCTTILSLAILHDYNLQDQCAFLAFKDSLTINVMLNFIEMFDRDLKLNTLYVLENACQNSSFAYEIFRLGGIITIIDSMCLDHIGIEESCSILLKILSFRRARRVIRRFGGISKLITLLDELSENFIEDNLFKVFLLLCKSEKNKYVCIRYGIGKIILKIILNISNNSAITLISLLAILLQIPIFRMQMMDKDLIISLINLIDVTNIELTRVICESFYYLSFDIHHLQFIYQYGFKKLKDILEQTNDSSIYCSIINILTEFIRTNENISNDIILNMMKFLKNSSNNSFYLLRIIQSLNQLTKLSQTIKLFKQENIFQDFIYYLQNINHSDIQLNILFILQQCAKDKEAANMIIDNNGLQELWTLFKLALLPIKIAAGWTIRNCLASIENHGELIRSFDGIFYFILNTLSTENIQLLEVTLGIIAEIVQDEYNSEIFTELGIVSKISQLNSLDNPQLSKSFCNVIATLLNLPKNQQQFGNRHVIMALKNYFKQNDNELSKSLTKAIYDLSLIPSNCIILHDVGIALDLLKLIGDDDPYVQEKSANALRNMRQLLNDNRQIERSLNKNINRVPMQKIVKKRSKCIF
ncbi:unnamed protein product [Adineta steineri]|uniref:Uncharacterized protein n=1 Tax=Adineta steineri TaxID=433720 RepID=A0A815E0L5_9BILA|nr:unnamed protein product [Adineta steineri]CAF1308557.1 unnamed protein product [Adineta steineri]CAF1563939.1 unnamed protein product [Adineta steineri]CAF1566203.1 unnamed protein product [Adineta steineri]